jgi:hypothetical protein
LSAAIITEELMQSRPRAARLVLATALAIASAPLGAQSPVMPRDVATPTTSYEGRLARLVAAGGPAPSASVTVALYEPAYVALVEILPEVGARMLWPTAQSGPERPLEEGTARIPIPPGFERDPYAPKRPLPDEPTARWVYLVASREPLGLVPGRRSAEAIANAVGRMTFFGSSPLDLAAAIQVAMTPGATTADWLAYTPGGRPTIVGRDARCGGLPPDSVRAYRLRCR